MIDHEHALELAAAALDFGLSDEDRAALQAHLDGCADCRSADQLLRADAQRVADLSMRDAPDRLRGRVLASAGTSARGERPASAASGASVQRPPIIPTRHRRLAAVLATAAVVVVLIGGTLFWQTTSTPSRGVAASSPSPSDSTPSPSGGPGASPVDDTSAPVADMTADDIEGGVVALSSGFRLASRDGRPAADLAAGLKVDPPISFVVAPEGDGRSVHITPNEPLKAGTIYRFRLTAPDGRTLDSWAFQAHQPLQVSATLPRDTTTDVPTDTGIEVTFDQDGVVDAKGHFSIVPKVGGRFEQHGRTLAFVPTKRLARHTIYTVTISRGVEVGGSGERLEADVHFRFETAGGP